MKNREERWSCRTAFRVLNSERGRSPPARFLICREPRHTLATARVPVAALRRPSSCAAGSHVSNAAMVVCHPLHSPTVPNGNVRRRPITAPSSVTPSGGNIRERTMVRRYGNKRHAATTRSRCLQRRPPSPLPSAVHHPRAQWRRTAVVMAPTGCSGSICRQAHRPRQNNDIGAEGAIHTHRMAGGKVNMVGRQAGAVGVVGMRGQPCAWRTAAQGVAGRQ